MFHDDDFASMTRQMQNFYAAVRARTEPAPHETADALSAVHGELAAIEAVARSTEAMRDGEPEQSRFWLRVYGCLIAPEGQGGSTVTLH